MNKIACVGSRMTPPYILTWMRSTGAEIVNRGYTLVSGNAPGADQAWAKGGNDVNPSRVELCLPWGNFESHVIHPDNIVHALPDERIDMRERYYKLAQEHYHSRRWYTVTETARKLFARNAMIVTRVQAVFGFLSDTGGTRHTFRLAKALGLPSFNVALEDVRHTVERILKGRQSLEASR